MADSARQVSEAALFFVQELSSAGDNLAVLKRLGVILKHVDDEVIINEIIPCLTDLVFADEDEGLVWEMAAHSFPLLCTRSANIFGHLTSCYIHMFEHEESAIRTAALQGLTKILAEQNSTQFVSGRLLPLHNDLLLSNSPFARCSCAGILALIFPHLDVASRQPLLTAYLTLVHDEQPLLRLAFANNLVSIVEKACTQEIDEFLSHTTLIAWKDEFVEQVRVDSCVALLTMASMGTEAKAIGLIENHLDKITTDSSWRVKSAFLNNVDKLMRKGFEDLNSKFLWPAVSVLTEDPVLEIAGQAYRVIHDCAANLRPEVFRRNVAKRINHFMLNIRDADDASSISVAMIIGDFAHLIVNSTLITYYRSLIQHQVTTVRAAAVAQLPALIAVLDPGVLITPLVWISVKDSQWRVRMEMAKVLPSLGVRIDEEERLRILMTALLDLCEVVRATAIESIPLLDDSEWLEFTLLPNLLSLYRISREPEAYEALTGRQSSEAGTGDSPTLSVCTDIIRKSPRNIKSFTVVKTFLKAMTSCVLALRKLSPEVFDCLLESVKDSIPNVRLVAWQCVYKVYKIAPNTMTIQRSLEERKDVENDADVLHTMQALE